MNEILLLILSYLPIPVELAFFLLIAKFIKGLLSKASALPDKLVKETTETKNAVVRVVSQNEDLKQINEKLAQENEELKALLKGFIKHE